MDRASGWDQGETGHSDPNEMKPRQPVDKNERFDTDSQIATTFGSQLSESSDGKI